MREEAKPRRSIAGWPMIAIGAAILGFASLCWAIWATRTLIDVRDRRIVRVSLAAVMADFVRDEARLARPPEQTAARTRAYLIAVERTLKREAESGTVVLVSEAVLGGSVPDRTDAVRRALAQSGESNERR